MKKLILISIIFSCIGCATVHEYNNSAIRNDTLYIKYDFYKLFDKNVFMTSKKNILKMFGNSEYTITSNDSYLNMAIESQYFGPPYIARIYNNLDTLHYYCSDHKSGVKGPWDLSMTYTLFEGKIRSHNEITNNFFYSLNSFFKNNLNTISNRGFNTVVIDSSQYLHKNKRNEHSLIKYCVIKCIGDQISSIEFKELL